MFFLIPGGGFFSFIILFLVIRLVFRSLFGGRSSHTEYRHYYYDPNQQNRQYNSNNGYNPYSNIYRPTKNYYAVLGLQENATDDEVKKSYRKLIMEYHPDTVANKNLSEAEKEVATKKFREVQEAYEEICKQRNIK